ncbi:uncharacterized protein [Spinacia oleracea]|uniref:Uncharacterized protein n=1 Tax=Spinacia oleracea TaxID=3562 RepID=A0A9R0JGM2_SPIOL|nr:uncharacterized protein LOC110805297 [Spinacia oleracea]
MELTLCNLKSQKYNYVSAIVSTTKQPPMKWVPPQKIGWNTKRGARVKCGKNTKLVVELEKELKEIENEGREEGGSTVVELLECLEREAIMGDDEGREPNDYNRRAQIFDKSSKVFKELRNANSDQ